METTSHQCLYLVSKPDKKELCKHPKKDASKQFCTFHENKLKEPKKREKRHSHKIVNELVPEELRSCFETYKDILIPEFQDKFVKRWQQGQESGDKEGFIYVFQRKDIQRFRGHLKVGHTQREELQERMDEWRIEKCELQWSVSYSRFAEELIHHLLKLYQRHLPSTHKLGHFEVEWFELEDLTFVKNVIDCVVNLIHKRYPLGGTKRMEHHHHHHKIKIAPGDSLLIKIKK